VTQVRVPPIPHWPGEFVELNGYHVYLRSVPAPNDVEMRRYSSTFPHRSPGEGPGEGPGEAPGEGPEPALCVHGLGGSSRNWTDLMDLLRPRLACAAVDLPGYGDSPPRPDGKFSISAMARTVTELIQAQQNGPVHLIGNSMGGAVALRAATRRPDLVRSLTLVSPALPDSRPRMDLLRFPVVSIPKLGGYLIGKYLAFPAERRVSDTLAACYYDVSLVPPERYAIEVAAQSERDAQPYAIRALIGSIRTLTAEQMFRLGPLSPWRAAAKLRVPALVIYGSHDILVRAQMAGRARKSFRTGTVVVLPDTGHVAMMERPDTVAGLILDMMNGNNPQPAGVVADERSVGLADAR
jgi:pimeloyl-ACP methyl ester carboxylesterase